MSPLAARRWLWLACLLALPAPVLLLGPGRIPPLAFAELGSLSVAIALAENARGAVLPIAGLLLGHFALWALLSWLGCLVAVRGLARLGPRGLRAATLGAVAAALAVACLLPIYASPFGTEARSTLLRVYR